MDKSFTSRGIHHSRTSFPLPFILFALLASPFVSSNVTFLAEKGKIKCDVPSVKLRENTRLTCYFPEDVSQTRRDFSVYRQIGMETEAVIDCWWLRGQLNCYVDPHYKYDKKISDRLTVEIQRVSASHIGTYSCTLANYIQDSLNTCDLSVILDRKSVCEIPSVKLKSQAVLTCYFPQDLSKTRTDFSVYHHSIPGYTDTVLSCTWNGDSLSCDTVRGYQFDKKVTSHLSLWIPTVQENHQGNYSCQAQDVLPENCSFALKTETTSSCHVPSVPEAEPTTLTCNYSVDISITRRDFRVIHFNIQGKKSTDILNCTWKDDRLVCYTAPGFEFNNSVTDHFFIEVPRVTQEHNGSYVCRLEGSDSDIYESCDFIVMTASQNTDNTVSAVASAVGPIAFLILLALIIVFIIFKRRSRTPKQNADDEEEDKSLLQVSNRILENYPFYISTLYFVPPFYFNRNTYSTFSLAGEIVSITESRNDHTVKLDLAMPTIFKSLRLLEEKETMFVISQFDYDDCLECLRKDSSKHNLSKLRDQRRNVKNYGDFDVLIVHRVHGALVGVVMTCNDETDKNSMVEDLEKSCQQLDNAYQMLVDLTTDQEPEISIHKLLILPNLQQESLKSVLRNDTNAAKVLAKCLELSKLNDLHKECMCADHLQDINKTHTLLKRRFSTQKREVVMEDNDYAKVLERFCGHTIKMPLIPRGVLPTTLQDAVNVTGNLFSRPMIQPQQRRVLKNPSRLVFLSGPPASGKTRTLVLTGKRWLYDGHDVHVVSTWRGSRTASSMIHAELSKYVKNMATSRKKGRVILQDFELKTKMVDSCVNKLSKAANGNVLHIIADETGPYEENYSTFKAFAKGLIKKVPQLHFWAASCFKGAVLDCFKNRIFSDSFTAPPAILLHDGVTKLVSDCDMDPHTPNSRNTAPTEGPPVKVIKHKKKQHQVDHPWECETCARKVVDFLQTLDICCAKECPHMTDASQHLHYSDVLMMFETESATNLPLCKKLRKKNVKVTILEEKQTKVATYFMSGVNQVVVAKWHHILGIKKKVVVYVGGDPELKNKIQNITTNWKRLRGLTSSSSLLIWVTEDNFYKDDHVKEEEEEEEEEEKEKEEDEG